MTGVFVTKGMSFGVDSLSFSIDEKGNSNGNLTLSLRYDACSAWIRAALLQRVEARNAKAIRIAAWAADDENAKSLAIEGEFLASLQAIVAAASAIDALYATIKELEEMPESITKAWAKNRTSRQIQVGETLRLIFGLSDENRHNISNLLAGIYKIRAAALHPSGKLAPPRYHPELNVHTEWRLVTFRSDIADAIVCNSIGLIWDLSHLNSKKKILKSNYINTLRSVLEEMLPDGRPNPTLPTADFWVP